MRIGASAGFAAITFALGAGMCCGNADSTYHAFLVGERRSDGRLVYSDAGGRAHWLVVRPSCVGCSEGTWSDGSFLGVELVQLVPREGGPIDCGDGICRDLSTDPESCGACGNACAAGEICSRIGRDGGVCGTSCVPGRTICSGGCRDLANDPLHCGDCGVACAPGEVCSGAVCVPGLTSCSDGFRDLAIDPMNCGQCGNVCEAGLVCAGPYPGVCSYPPCGYVVGPSVGLLRIPIPAEAGPGTFDLGGLGAEFCICESSVHGAYCDERVPAPECGPLVGSATIQRYVRGECHEVALDLAVRRVCAVDLVVDVELENDESGGIPGNGTLTIGFSSHFVRAHDDDECL